MNIKHLVGLGALGAVLMAGAAHAQTTPFYAAVDYTWSLSDPDPKPLQAVNVESLDYDKDTPNGWRITGGYQINPTWGIEVAYSDFGGVPVRGFVSVLNTTTNLLVPTKVVGKADLTAFEAVATATFPFAEGVDVVFRGGLHAWNEDQDVGTAESTGLAVSRSASESGVGFVGGLVLLFEFHPQWTARVGFNYYQGDNVTHSFNGGVVFKF
jgi:hypothetical protein